MTPLVEARGLTKTYKKVRALDSLDLVANDGHVVALLGPNGAGKTTFVRAVATLLRPDSGTLRVAGVNALKQPNEVRRRTRPSRVWRATSRPIRCDSTTTRNHQRSSSLGASTSSCRGSTAGGASVRAIRTRPRTSPASPR